MFWRKGDHGFLEELGTDGEQIPVEHSDQDRISGGLLHARHEEQREGLDENGKEGGEG